MSSILLLGDAPGVENNLRTVAGAGINTLAPEPFPASVEQLLKAIRASRTPDMVIMAPRRDQEAAALELVVSLVTYTDSVIAVVAAESAFSFDAFRAGTNDVLDPTANLAQVRDTLERLGDALTRKRSRLQEQARQSVQETTQMMTGQGEVILVASSGGGTGKTTMATNLAVGIAQCDAGASTVLVDAALQFGDVASYLEILATRNTLPVIERLVGDPLSVKAGLTLHESGLYVLPGALNPVASSKVTTDGLVLLVETLAQQFPYVVIDTSTGLNDHTASLLELADRLLIVTTPDVAHLRSTRALLDVLSDLGYRNEETLKVCMNFGDETGLNPRDMELTLGRKADWTMRTMPVVRVSTNKGIPVVVGRKPNDPARKAMAQMVKLFHSHDERQQAKTAATAGRRAL